MAKCMAFYFSYNLNYPYNEAPGKKIIAILLAIVRDRQCVSAHSKPYESARRKCLASAMFLSTPCHDRIFLISEGYRRFYRFV